MTMTQVASRPASLFSQSDWEFKFSQCTRTSQADQELAGAITHLRRQVSSALDTMNSMIREHVDFDEVARDEEITKAENVQPSWIEPTEPEVDKDGCSRKARAAKRLGTCVCDLPAVVAHGPLVNMTITGIPRSLHAMLRDEAKTLGLQVTELVRRKMAVPSPFSVVAKTQASPAV